MSWLTGLIRNSFLQNLKLGYISVRLFLCFQVEQTIFLTRRISLEIYAIQSSFRVFPFVFFTRSVIEPAPQNSITSCKTNTSIQPTLNTVPSCLAKQNNQAAALIWETLMKQRVSFILHLCLENGFKPNVSNVCQTYMEYVSH